jgi:uncharacterized membrane protein YfcA
MRRRLRPDRPVMTALAAISLGMLGLLAGLLIGAVGIGGVILVPALVYFGGIPIHAAIAGAMMSYVLTGLIGTLVYAGKNSIRWGMAGWLCAGAMPAALAGALAAGRASSLLLEILIGLLTAASGVRALPASPADDGARSAISNPALGFIGAVTGFGSALSGTGGPLILVPILMWLELPVLTAIALSQAIQLPIALLATAGNAWSGNLDLTLGVLLAAGLAVGTFVGARIAHAVPRAILRRAVAMVLVVVGAAITIKVIARLLA